MNFPKTNHPSSIISTDQKNAASSKSNLDRRDFLKTGLGLAVTAATPVSYLANTPKADAWILPVLRALTIFGRSTRAARGLSSASRAARNSKRAAKYSGYGKYGVAAGAAGTASQASAASWLGGASNLYFLADIFSWVSPSVIEEMQMYGAEELWINNAGNYNLHNNISVDVDSEYDEVYSDNLIVTATDLQSKKEDILFGTYASALPNQISRFYGHVNTFESNGVKKVTAKFLNDQKIFAFDEKVVLITDYSKVQLKRN